MVPIPMTFVKEVNFVSISQQMTPSLFLLHLLRCLLQIQFTISWNKGIPGATFTVTNPTARLQTGRFCWTPGAGQASNLPLFLYSNRKR